MCVVVRVVYGFVCMGEVRGRLIVSGVGLGGGDLMDGRDG